MREIREYVRTELRKIDAMYAEHESGMKFSELPKTKIDKLYRLSFGEFSNDSNNSNLFLDTVPVELKLYRRIERNTPSVFDSGVELAKRVRSNISHPKNYALTAISSVKPENFAVTEYEDNTDIYEIKLNLTFTVSNSL